MFRMVTLLYVVLRAELVSVWAELSLVQGLVVCILVVGVEDENRSYLGLLREGLGPPVRKTPAQSTVWRLPPFETGPVDHWVPIVHHGSVVQRFVDMG